MRIGVPREVKDNEFRVAITPIGVRELTGQGHQVAVETAAGLGSSITDEEYVAAGASIVARAEDVWSLSLHNPSCYMAARRTAIQNKTGTVWSVQARISASVTDSMPTASLTGALVSTPACVLSPIATLASSPTACRQPLWASAMV